MRFNPALKLAIRKTSLNDYPGRISSVLFFQGCNLRCPWCHNPELVLGTAPFISFDEALAHLQKRQSVLGGVVLSGGEPCLCGDLGKIIGEIKKLSLPVKLDTNGMCPSVLEEIFRLPETRPDYIALDLKIAPSRYRELIGSMINSRREDKIQPELNDIEPPSVSLSLWEKKPGEDLKRSAELIRGSGVAHEYRSLALPHGYFTEEDVEALAPLTDNAPWFFRTFRGGNCLDPAWDSREESAGKSSELIKTLAARAKTLGKNGISQNG